MFEAETDGVIVRVTPEYLPHESDAAAGRHVWGYHVEVENRREAPVKLLSRYWRITEENGLTHEVRGEGVVGKQPTILPGRRFEYSSAAPLSSPSGLMSGAYEMIEPLSRIKLRVTVPAFPLDSPTGPKWAN